MRGKLQRPCGTKPMPSWSRSRGVRVSIARPAKRTWPPKRRLSPYTARRSVDLPAPLGPITVVIVPSTRAAEKPTTTGWSVYPTESRSSSRMGAPAVMSGPLAAQFGGAALAEIGGEHGGVAADEAGRTVRYLAPLL